MYELGQLHALMGEDHQEGNGEEYDRGYSDEFTKGAQDDHNSEVQELNFGQK